MLYNFLRDHYLVNTNLIYAHYEAGLRKSALLIKQRLSLQYLLS